MPKKQSFSSYFKEVYGTRWPKLYDALKASTNFKVILVNKYAESSFIDEYLQNCLKIESSYFDIRVIIDKSSLPYPKPSRTNNEEMLSHYIMDYASILVVEQLQLEPLHKVLDMCAAPGGKAIAIGQVLKSHGGSLLHCNEINGERRKRLAIAIANYLPQEISVPVLITHRDATRWTLPESFDRILVDAPCSAERHMVQSELNLLSYWTIDKIMEKSKLQKELLIKAIELLKIDGIVVYATCSINIMENDDVVQYALRHSDWVCQPITQPLSIGEATKYGHIILPDVCHGAGPIYLASIKKVSLRIQR